MRLKTFRQFCEMHAVYDSSTKRIVSKHAIAGGAKETCRTTNLANWHRNEVADRYKIMELPKLLDKKFNKKSKNSK